jgi:hypothetical protein
MPNQAVSAAALIHNWAEITQENGARTGCVKTSWGLGFDRGLICIGCFVYAGVGLVLMVRMML